MYGTRSNRQGDWTQMLAMRNNYLPSGLPPRDHCEKELRKINDLPTIPTRAPSLKSAGSNPFVDLNKPGQLLDTSMFAPTNTPEGFGVELLPHQKRGLTWMLTIENPNQPVFTTQQNRVYGGICCDKPGTGKSVLMVALMKMNPCTFFFQDDSSRIRSKATLLLCPPSIVEQWAEEIRRCDSGMKILQLLTLSQLYAVCSLEVALVDVVIMPYHVLADSSYIGSATQIDTLQPPSLTTYEDLIKYRGVLSRFHFHRIVYDEVHEIYDQTRSQNFPFVPFMEKFHSNWRWGLTGTPPQEKELFHAVLSCVAGVDLSSDKTATRLIAQIVRSSNPNLGIPLEQQEIKWINLSAQELAVYNLFRKRSVDEQLRACSHFNVNDIPMNGVRFDEGLTMDELTSKLLEAHQRSLNEMEKALPDVEASIPHHVARVEAFEVKLAHAKRKEDKGEIRQKLRRARDKLRGKETFIRQCNRDIPRLRVELKYFRTILETLKDGEKKECPICFEDVEPGIDTIAITQCGHLFCTICIDRLDKENNMKDGCPLCRAPLQRDSIMPIKLNVEAETDNQREIFGSKISELVQYVGEQRSLDATFKFIIFVQYAKLAKLITVALERYRIATVNLAGTSKVRDKALKTFQQKDIPVLIMSSERSVAGVNIIAASHVIIFHPFNLDTVEESIAAEEQGIARARRFGQTRSVRVVRFVTRGTIEQTMTKRRLGAGSDFF